MKLIIQKINLFFVFYGENIWRGTKFFIPLILFLFIFFYFNVCIRMYHLSSLDAEIKGQLILKEKKDGLTYTDSGAKKTTNYYKVVYSYQVEQDTIESEEILTIKSLRWKEKAVLKSYSTGDEVTILYSSKHPKRSMIKLNNQENIEAVK